MSSRPGQVDLRAARRARPARRPVGTPGARRRHLRRLLGVRARAPRRRGDRDRRRAARGRRVAAAVARAARARGRRARAWNWAAGSSSPPGRSARAVERRLGQRLRALTRGPDRRARSTSPSAARSCSTCAIRCGRWSGSAGALADGGELRLLEPFSPRLTAARPAPPRRRVRRRRSRALTWWLPNLAALGRLAARRGLRDERRLGGRAARRSGRAMRHWQAAYAARR